jgi:hypothetical protein
VASASSRTQQVFPEALLIQLLLKEATSLRATTGQQSLP